MAAVIASCGLISTPGPLPWEQVRLSSCEASKGLSRPVFVFRCSGRTWSTLVTRAPMSPLSFFTLSRTCPSSVTTWLQHGNTSLSSALNLQSKSWSILIAGLFGAMLMIQVSPPPARAYSGCGRQTNFFVPKRSIVINPLKSQITGTAM